MSNIKKLKLSGVIVPIITPKINGAVDKISLKNLINFLIKSNIDCIFILGTMGEFQFLSMEQKKEIIKTSMTIVKKRVPIIVGVSDKNIENIIKLIKYSKQQKADAVVIAPLCINGNQKQNMKTLLEISQLPIILYNNPEIHDNKSVPLEFVKEFSSNPKVIGMKDSSGDWNYFKKLLDFSSENFAVYEGSEKLILKSLNQGAKGIVPGSANVYPELFKKIYTTKDPVIINKIISVHDEIKELSNDFIAGIKIKLVKLNLIKSEKMFKPSV